MPYRLIILGRGVALTLGGDDVQKFWLIDIFQSREHTYQLLHIVTVQLTEVAEVKTLEKVTVLQQALLYSVACLLAETQHGRHV